MTLLNGVNSRGKDKGMNTTALICGQCGIGQYVQAHGVLFVCSTCDHAVNSETDVYPHIDADEMLTVVNGILSIES